MTKPAPCPNHQCRHSALMHRVVDAEGRIECDAIDRRPDDRRQRYVEARCPCGRQQQ